MAFRAQQQPLVCLNKNKSTIEMKMVVTGDGDLWQEERTRCPHSGDDGEVGGRNPSVQRKRSAAGKEGGDIKWRKPTVLMGASGRTDERTRLLNIHTLTGNARASISGLAQYISSFRLSSPNLINFFI